ncbi:MAG: GerAB/ArcD/ProY family transporter [Ruminococcus sp.]|nr:GerAB/ArcD/ProY family transporter [Ruminococcus sp.]
MNRISQLQLFAVMLCGHAFSLMTFFPYTFDNPSEYMIGVLISTFIEIFLAVPAVIIYKRFEGRDPCSLAGDSSRALKITAGIFYTFVFFYFAYRVTGNFVYFLDSVLSGYFPRALVVVSVCATAVYLGLMKPSVIGKTSGIMLALFALFTVLVIGSSFSSTGSGFLSFHLASENISHGIGEAVKCELLRNLDMLFLLFFLPKLKGSPVRVSALYLGVKLIMVELSVGFVTVMLGDFAMISKLPFSSMASYSTSSMIERFDAAFMAVWVILAIVRLGAVFHCSSDCIQAVIPKADRTVSVVISAAIPAAAAVYKLTNYEWESTAYDMNGWLITVTALLFVPLMISAFVLLRERRSADVRGA